MGKCIQDNMYDYNKVLLSLSCAKYFTTYEALLRSPSGVLHSFSIKNIFYDKMELRFIFTRQYILIHCCQYASAITLETKISRQAVIKFHFSSSTKLKAANQKKIELQHDSFSSFFEQIQDNLTDKLDIEAVVKEGSKT